MRVPVYVSMVITLLYIVLGAVLFSEWEGWELSEAAYFCFITLATIGFGDFVPGQFRLPTSPCSSLLVLFLLYWSSFLAGLSSILVIVLDRSFSLNSDLSLLIFSPSS